MAQGAGQTTIPGMGNQMGGPMGGQMNRPMGGQLGSQLAPGGQAGKPSAPGGQTMPMTGGQQFMSGQQGQVGQLGGLFNPLGGQTMPMQQQMQQPGMGSQVMYGQGAPAPLSGTSPNMLQASPMMSQVYANHPPPAGLASLAPQQQTGLAHYGPQGQGHQ
jgi:hypothetical protein